MTFRWKCPVVLVLAVLAPVAARAAEPPGAESGEPPASFAAPELALTPVLGSDRPGLKKAPSAALQRFFEKHSPRWDVRWDLRSGRPHLIQGAGVPLLPGRGNRLPAKASGGKEVRLETVAVLLRRFMAENPGLLGVAHLDLRLDRSRSLAYGEDLWMVELQQFHQGLPVLGAHVFFRLSHGNVTQLGTRRLGDVHLDAVLVNSGRLSLSGRNPPNPPLEKGGALPSLRSVQSLGTAPRAERQRRPAEASARRLAPLSQRGVGGDFVPEARTPETGAPLRTNSPFQA